MANKLISGFLFLGVLQEGFVPARYSSTAHPSSSYLRVFFQPLLHLCCPRFVCAQSIIHRCVNSSMSVSQPAQLYPVGIFSGILKLFLKACKGNWKLILFICGHISLSYALSYTSPGNLLVVMSHHGVSYTGLDVCRGSWWT